MSKKQQEGKLGEKKKWCEIEADDECGIEERKSVSDAGFGCIKQPCDSRNAMSEFRSFRHWETSREWCAEWKHSVGHLETSCEIVLNSLSITISKYSLSTI